MKKIVLATGNQGKVREMADLLADFGFDVVAQSEFNVSEVAETGTTFIENAIIKARHAAKETGLAAIADDSGLEVDFLQGAPGIYSARYAGEKASDQEKPRKALKSDGRRARSATYRAFPLRVGVDAPRKRPNPYCLPRQMGRPHSNASTR